MKNIIDSAVRPYPKPHYLLSLTGKLEAVIGKYFVSGEGTRIEVSLPFIIAKKQHMTNAWSLCLIT